MTCLILLDSDDDSDDEQSHGTTDSDDDESESDDDDDHNSDPEFVSVPRPPAMTDREKRLKARQQTRDRKSTRLNSSHVQPSRMPSSA